MPRDRQTAFRNSEYSISSSIELHPAASPTDDAGEALAILVHGKTRLLRAYLAASTAHPCLFPDEARAYRQENGWYCPGVFRPAEEKS